jgi:hypothetical protein
LLQAKLDFAMRNRLFLAPFSWLVGLIAPTSIASDSKNRLAGGKLP